MASGHVSRIKRPNTWLHRPMLQNVKKVLANPEPSTHGTSRHLVRCNDMSAVRVRPEVIGRGSERRDGPTADSSLLERRSVRSRYRSVAMPLTIPELLATGPRRLKRG
jgi:hypothetical protein